MKRLNSKDFHQDLINLYDNYAHGKITKREFLEKAKKFSVGISAVALLDLLSPKYSYADQVKADDPDIVTGYVNYDSPKGHGTIKGYLVKPKTLEKLNPAVLVIHENRGLNPYISDVARRLAKAKFIAFAPDGLSAKGGYPGNDDQGREIQASLDQEKLKQDLFAALQYLTTVTKGKVGAVGFCYGGGIVNQLAVNFPNLSAAVPYYGPQADEKDVSKIKTPLLLHYAELDSRINEGIPKFEQALKDNKKNYTLHMYLGVNHGFHNDTTPRYDKQAADLSWSRTIEFFKKNLSTI
jgi:carboxymethylenebutenolidase